MSFNRKMYKGQRQMTREVQQETFRKMLNLTSNKKEILPIKKPEIPCFVCQLGKDKKRMMDVWPTVGEASIGSSNSIVLILEIDIQTIFGEFS
jgi:hypothetical protein